MLNFYRLNIEGSGVTKLIDVVHPQNYYVNFAKQRLFDFDVNKQFILCIKFLMILFSIFVTGEVDDKGLQRDQI